MQAKGIKAMMAALEKVGAKVCGTTDDFYNEKNEVVGIWVAAESTPDLFDYWSKAWSNTFGVKPSLDTLVEESGWYFEWYDAGTMMVWPN
jgi:hypothetical protein